MNISNPFPFHQLYIYASISNKDVRTEVEVLGAILLLGEGVNKKVTITFFLNRCPLKTGFGCTGGGGHNFADIFY